MADDTVVVLTADHGDMLGERGLWYKMNFFEDCGAGAADRAQPDSLRPPGRVAAPVSLVDVLPTLLELVGEGAPESVDPLPGQSLLDLCRRPLGSVRDGREEGGLRGVHGRGCDRTDRDDPAR